MNFLKLSTIGVAALVAGFSTSAIADVSAVTLAVQNGTAYLPVMVMKEQKLFEKHAAKEGLKDAKLTVNNLGKPSMINDALLSNSAQYGSVGVPSLILMNDKTKGDYKALGSLAYVPMYLNTSNPNVKSLKDFTEKDKIAVPSVKVSVQAVTLQMAAVQAFGKDKFDSLDKYTISMTHPDAMVALLSGKSEVNAHFASPPFANQEQADARVHPVINSYDVLGGKSTFILLIGSNKFAQANPKTNAAMSAALEEAQAWITNNKADAAKLYVEKSGTKESIAEVLSQLSLPDVGYALTPRGTMKYAQFMYDVGTIKTEPKSWKDFAMENLHGRDGS